MGKKKRRHRTATTAYPCFLPDLGDSAGAGRVADTKVNQNSGIASQVFQFEFIDQEIKP
jgi:hypothetical protein